LFVNMFPEPEWRDRALIGMARCYDLLGKRQEAVDALYDALPLCENRALQTSACRELSRLLANLQDTKRASSVLIEFAEQSCDPEDSAYAKFHEGMMEFAKGEKSYPIASEKFQMLIFAFPNHRYAKSANAMLKHMQYLTQAVKPPRPRG